MKNCPECKVPMVFIHGLTNEDESRNDKDLYQCPQCKMCRVVNGYGEVK